jgi:hypothetical protein
MSGPPMQWSTLRNLAIVATSFAMCAMACAQVIADPWEGMRIDAVRIVLANPPDAPVEAAAFEERARGVLDLYPGTSFRNLFLDWGLGKLRSQPWVDDARADLAPGNVDGIVVTVTVTLADKAKAQSASLPFPYLLQGADSLIKLKFMTAGLGYSNHNAWYGQPAAFIGANPLASKPAGAGWASWAEGAAELGIQGIGPIAPSVYLYGSLSYMQSGSAGQELFTNEPRSYGAIEDAYVGFVFGNTWEDGSRLVCNVSAGRQPFQIADGMLIRITAGNGFDRAALQLNPRWAADNLLLAEARYNTLRVQAFRLDPDEVPAIDSRTIIDGLNVDGGLGSAMPWGLTYLHVPQSGYGYYTPTAAGTRAGLNVFDARLSWLPTLQGGTGPHGKAELAYQANDANSFPMKAWGGYVEAGYTLGEMPWRPTLSYRLSYFSGDNPRTTTYERWDPLLSGGTPEEWVQGINHYKMFQDSNVVAQRFQAKLQPSPTTEIVPQVWLFGADQTNNLGGTLSQLAGTKLGWELNVTGKYYPTRNLYFQGGLAATFPLSGVMGAIDGNFNRWVSAMLMARVRY